MTCPVCGTENAPDRKFCGECGSPLAIACGTCGAANAPGMKFCGECGSPLVAGAVRRTPEAAPAGPAAERRLVSVLFADLVGFTSLSETRDAEEVRDLLSRYFETSRQLIGRFGGTVEKFIGDAVMAVWGTPTAREDDAERAVRAALDLVGAVAALGAEVGAPDLAARVGVLTGEAAVTIGADGQGMVAGDLVNTASRIQSAAAPGTVLTADATRRATEAAIIYEDAGSHELKGKAEPAHLYRAVRVIGGRGGALRSTGLEAPFVGRDRELRLLKQLFHAAADESTAHLLSVVGIAGIGKSRLSWEFYKYVDGLSDTVWWHRGRCLAYGEGVTYWALAEMLRGRAGIAEGEAPDQASAKLREAILEHVPDPEERRWVEPRLAHLLGLDDRERDRGGWEREDLFGAARLFFERLTERHATVLVFEDMQWAEPALVDFIEYLLDWSRNHPLFVLTLARPEVLERHPRWAAGKRNFTSLYLEPLAPAAMEALLTGLVPGLPGALRERVLDRAEGVPLYAVETVRMLIDRGLLVREGNGYRLAEPGGEVDELAIPETLHALIAARLDGLGEQERRLLQDAAVLGKAFTSRGLSALTGLPVEEVESMLASLVRKEVLTQQADPRSPERGQFVFLQDLVKRVAYETLSKRERKARHLAAVAYLEEASGYQEDEIVEVIASHLLDAHRAAPDAPDAPEILERALAALERAGRRTASLGATEEAQRYFERAAELATDPVARAELLEQAGIEARAGGRGEAALSHYEEAIRLFTDAGLTHPAARVSARTGDILWTSERIDEALERLGAALSVLADEEPDADIAALTAELGRFRFFHGDLDEALEHVDRALEIAEALWLPETISQALNTKHLVLSARGRSEEAHALIEHALRIALENDAPGAALRAYINLSHLMAMVGRPEDSVAYAEAGIALARRVGIRWSEWWFLDHLGRAKTHLGLWDEALRAVAEIPDPDEVPDAMKSSRLASAGTLTILVGRGELDAAAHVWERFWLPVETSSDVQMLAVAAEVGSLVDLASGRPREARDRASRGLSQLDELSPNHPAGRACWVRAMEASLALGETAEATRLLELLEVRPPGHIQRYLRAHMARFRGHIAAARGDDEGAETEFRAAIALLEEIGYVFELAVVQVEFLEWLASRGRDGEPAAAEMAAEARGTFERLRARPWLERMDREAARSPVG